MHPDQAASSNGRPPFADDRARRQALVIEKLSEDIAMLRGATVAMNARLRGTNRRGYGRSAGIEVLEVAFPLDVRAAAAARVAVAQALRHRLAQSVLETAQLIVSELVANSVRHSAVPPGQAVIVRVRLEDDMCRLEVEDPGRDGVIAPRTPDLESGRGLGLSLVQSLSERWGVERVAKGGTRVWARIACSPVPIQRLLARSPVPAATGEGPSDELLAAPPRSESDRRDRLAHDRDLAAEARDRAAEERDAQLAARGDELARLVLEAAAEDRRRAAADRREAAIDRAQARRDRVSADQDQLTGAMSRGAGVRAVEHEIARVKRSGEALTLAFVDVDGLKKVNDTQGHAFGDTLLRSVVVALRSGLRESDVIVRYGGDEFLCALPGATDQDAARRVELCAKVLAADWPTSSVSVGLAELRRGEDAATLIARADEALYAIRGRLLETR